jgi:heme exporter protein B
VAIERRHQRHALFRFNGGGAFQIAGGVLCVATLFASVTALNQAWTRELRHQVLDAQRMAPAPPAALFLAKAIANFIFVTVVQIVLAPLFAIFYNLHPLGEKWLLLVVLPLGTWALVVNGTFFAALSIRTRNRPSSFRRCWVWSRPPPPSC